jgi:hypothetical protein
MNDQETQEVSIDVKKEMIDKTIAQMDVYLNEGAETIAEVFERDKKVEVFLKANYEVKDDKLKIKTSINFVTERYKKDNEQEIDLSQLQIPFGEDQDKAA